MDLSRLRLLDDDYIVEGNAWIRPRNDATHSGGSMKPAIIGVAGLNYTIELRGGVKSSGAFGQ